MSRVIRGVSQWPYEQRVQLAIHVRGLCARNARCCVFCRLGIPAR